MTYETSKATNILLQGPSDNTGAIAYALLSIAKSLERIVEQIDEQVKANDKSTLPSQM